MLLVQSQSFFSPFRRMKNRNLQEAETTSPGSADPALFSEQPIPDQQDSAAVIVNPEDQQSSVSSIEGGQDSQQSVVEQPAPENQAKQIDPELVVAQEPIAISETPPVENQTPISENNVVPQEEVIQPQETTNTIDQIDTPAEVIEPAASQEPIPESQDIPQVPVETTATTTSNEQETPLPVQEENNVPSEVPPVQQDGVATEVIPEQSNSETVVEVVPTEVITPIEEPSTPAQTSSEEVSPPTNVVETPQPSEEVSPVEAPIEPQVADPQQQETVQPVEDAQKDVTPPQEVAQQENTIPINAASQLPQETPSEVQTPASEVQTPPSEEQPAVESTQETVSEEAQQPTVDITEQPNEATTSEQVNLPSESGQVDAQQTPEQQGESIDPPAVEVVQEQPAEVAVPIEQPNNVEPEVTQPVAEEQNNQEQSGSSIADIFQSQRDTIKDAIEASMGAASSNQEQIVTSSSPFLQDTLANLERELQAIIGGRRSSTNLTEPLGGSSINFQQPQVSDQLDLVRYRESNAEEISQDIQENQPRIDAHIQTDKVVYRPGDTMFVEVYLFDTFQKTPFTDQGRQFPIDIYYESNYFYPYSLYASMNILNQLDVSIFQTSTSSVNSTMSFTYQIPEDQTGGEYKIVIQGSYMADAIRVIRIREYEKQELVVQAELDQESYLPGDTVKGVLRVKTQDGSQFQQVPTYSYVVNFGENSQVNATNQRFDSTGYATFNFTIPEGTNVSQATIAFTVFYQSTTVPYSRTFTIVQPNQIVVQFVPETYNYVLGVPNKVYFQSYANEERKNTIELNGETFLIRVVPGANQEDQVTRVQEDLQTIHLGRGYFEFTPNSTDEKYFLSSSGVRYPLNISDQVDIEDWEINFSPSKKVLENSEQINVRLFTNSKIDPTDVYILGLYNKERALQLQQLQFDKDTSYEYNLEGELVNGGVLRVALFRVIRPLIWYERFENLSQGRQQSTQVNMSSVFNENMSSNRQSSNYSKRLYIESPYYVYYSIPRGETLVFKKPAERLDLVITTDKEVYRPGDLVNFEVKVTSLPTQDNNSTKYVSVVVTDDSVFRELPQRLQPPSLPAMILLEKEVFTPGFEFFNSDQYLEHIYQPAAEVNSTDYKLDLLLGVQGWRYGFFFTQMINQWAQVTQNMTFEDKYQLEKVFAYKFVAQSIPYPVYKESGISAVPPMASEINAPNLGSGSATGGGISAEETTAPVAPVVDTTGAPIEQAVELSVSEREQALWTFIKEARSCKFVPNTRYFSNTQRLSFFSDIGSRLDFTDTLYYTTANATDKQGVFRGSFFLSDLITQFRITANAFDTKGRLGYQKEVITSRKSFYLNYQLPIMMIQGDRLNIPIYTYNTLDNTDMRVRLSIVDFQDEYIQATLDNENEAFTLQAKQSAQTGNLTLEATNITDNAFVQVRGVAQTTSVPSQRLQDALIKELRVQSPGVLQEQSQGGFISNEKSLVAFLFTIPETQVPETQQFTAEIFPSGNQALIEAIRRIISYPTVCTYCGSSTAYIQVQALDSALQLSEQESQSIKQDVTNQYQQLASAELATGGFSPYSGSTQEADLLTTAQDLLFLGAVNEAGLASDTGLFDRTLQYVLSTQNAEGSFIRPGPVYSNQPQYLVDAFIVWVLSEVGYTDLDKQLQQLNTIAQAQIQQGPDADLYFLGLLSATYYNLNQTEQAQQYADFLASQQSPDGTLNQVVTFFTPVSEQRADRYQEATAAAAIAWQNDYKRYASNIQKAVTYLVDNVYFGYYFYPTQASILALKAIVDYVQQVNPIEGSGDFILRIDGQVVSRLPFSSQEVDQTIMFNTEQVKLSSGAHNATIAVENYIPDNANSSNFTALYQMSITYDDTEPKPSNESSLALVVTRAPANVNESLSAIGSLVSYTFQVTNKATTQPSGLVILIFRPPSCYQMNFEAFETLRNNGQISAYELKQGNTEAWIYLDSIDAGQTKNIVVDAVQQFQGICQERPQTAFEYYSPGTPVHAFANV